ncbi:uncharacterized protein EI90DRAFT_3095025 [Cantharellus anzutake]|uniref:uncharacterized protein n=1 Tax=Cantharellus anzutake TaxID=1750568 RepID=UPI0019067257|nr:uncharacterized protein EI90DRAFT_3095025 [Cantharellus anzutake]KAF8311931.1 hypothetical protein EI90DRAFT_3095025 [Cantharellus anzutake]
MLLGGVTMMTRSPIVAWTTLAVGLWGYLNSHPLRTKDGGNSVQGMIFAIGAIISAYVPRFILQPQLPASPSTS